MTTGITYDFRGGPLDGRQRTYFELTDWVTAKGKAAPRPSHPRWLERAYEADHEGQVFHWRPVRDSFRGRL